MKRFLLAPALILALLIPQTVFSDESDVPEEAWLYSDLNPNHVFADAIEFMTEENYVEGYEDGTFLPDEEINRAEALKIIMIASNIIIEEETAELETSAELEKETTGETDENADDGSESDGDVKEAESVEETEILETRTMNFPDMKDEDKWYYEYIETAYEQHIVDGHDDGYFRPEEVVNRAQALKMFTMSRNLNLTANAEDENWYEQYMSFAEEKALIIPIRADNHTEENPAWDYLPSQNLTRGELCEIIYRYMNGIYTGETEYGVASYYGYSFDGANTASGTPLEAYGYMAAHQTLPFGTWVRVTNLANNLSVDVVIVDRGPYVTGRIIDLTPGAFEEIAALSAGLAHTYIEILK